MAKKQAAASSSAKIKMPARDLIEFASLVTMPGTFTLEEETKRKKAVLFPEFEGIVKDGKLRVIMANKTGNVYARLLYNCEVIQPGKVWCGYTDKLSEYASAMKVDGDVVVEFDKTIVFKTTDVTVKMRNLSEESLQYPAAARTIDQKFITTAEPWIYKAQDGDKQIDAKLRVNIADLKPIVSDGSLMDQAYYPMIVANDGERSSIIVQAKSEFDSIERRIAPIESNGGEFATEYQVGVDSVLLNLSGEVTIRAGSKTPMIIVSEGEKFKITLYIAPRMPDAEATITEEMFSGTDSVDLTPTTTVETPVDGSQSGQAEQDGADQDDFV